MSHCNCPFVILSSLPTLFILALGLLLSTTAIADQFRAKVIAIKDGDTIEHAHELAS